MAELYSESVDPSDHFRIPGRTVTALTVEFTDAQAADGTTEDAHTSQFINFGDGWTRVAAILDVTAKTAGAGDAISLKLEAKMGEKIWEVLHTVEIPGDAAAIANMAAVAWWNADHPSQNVHGGTATATDFDKINACAAAPGNSLSAGETIPFFPLTAADSMALTIVVTDALGGDALFTGTAKMRFF